jgi:hypothetical protein
VTVIPRRPVTSHRGGVLGHRQGRCRRHSTTPITPSTCEMGSIPKTHPSHVGNAAPPHIISHNVCTELESSLYKRTRGSLGAPGTTKRGMLILGISRRLKVQSGPTAAVCRMRLSGLLRRTKFENLNMFEGSEMACLVLRGPQRVDSFSPSLLVFRFCDVRSAHAL